jgi:hypothetical protein
MGVSEGRVADGVKRMIADGNYELAARALSWTKDRFPNSRALSELEREVYFKLAEKYEGFSPFKYIVYTDRMRAAASALEH